MDIDSKKMSDPGLICAKALKVWIGEQFAKDPSLDWSDEEKWHDLLIMSEIRPLLDRHFCMSGDRIYFPNEKTHCSDSCLTSEIESCHIFLPCPFRHIPAIGNDLKLLRRYLSPGGDEPDPIYEDDFTDKINAMRKLLGGPEEDKAKAEIRKIEAARIKLKVIWSFVVNWVEKNILQGDSLRQGSDMVTTEVVEVDEELAPGELRAEENSKKRKEWTKSEVDKLRELCQQALSWREIAVRMFPRTRDAVAKKAKELGTQKRFARQRSRAKR